MADDAGREFAVALAQDGERAEHAVGGDQRHDQRGIEPRPDDDVAQGIGRPRRHVGILHGLAARDGLAHAADAGHGATDAVGLGRASVEPDRLDEIEFIWSPR